MRGTRYGDFSRLEAEVAKGYRGVLLQQGRVQLDSDPNVQAELAQHELRSALRDLIGESWGPESDAGFQISPITQLEFDGGGGLELARDGEEGALTLPIVEQLTIELALAWEGGPGTLLDAARGDGTIACYRLEIEDDGQLVLTLAGDPPFVLRASAPLAAGVETRVSVVFGADSIALLADARQLAGAGRESYDWVSAAGGVSVLVLGSTTVPGTGPGFRGLCTSVRLWGSELSPAQLAGAVQLGESQGERPKPLAWWRFDRPGPAALADVVGGCTALAQGASHPRPRLVDLRIGAGRYYVGGVRCERGRDFTYLQQAAGAGPPLPRRGRHLVYLEAWEETVTAVQDPALLEVALGGLDTAVRTRIATCVRVAEAGEDPGSQREQSRQGRLAARHEGPLVPGNHLYRVEVHAGGQLPEDQPPEWEIAIVEIDFDRWELVLAEAWRGTRSGPFEIMLLAEAGPDGRSHHRHRVAGVEDDGRRLRLATDPSPLIDRRSLRVSGRRPAPSFKWSRDNGTDLFAIVRSRAGAHTAEVLPARWLAPLAAGDVVEPVAENALLEDPAPALLNVLQAAEETGRVSLSGPLPAGTTLLRRWHHSPTDADGAIAGDGRWTELEDGIAFQAHPGAYRRGDYWWIPSRESLGSIEWPHDGGGPRALAPSGVERLTAPLALLELGHRRVHSEDLRAIGGLRAATPADLDATEEADEAGASGAGGGRGAGELGAGGAAPAPASHARGRELALDASSLSGGAGVDGDADEASLATDEPEGSLERASWRLLGTIDGLTDDFEDIVGTAAGIVLATATELLKLEGHSLERLIQLPVARTGFSLRAVGEELLLLGGRPRDERADGRVLAADPAAGSWRERARLPGPREGVAFVVADGVLHAFGGHASGFLHGQRAGHHVLEPERDRWRRSAPRLASRVAYATAVALDGRLHLLGGLERDGASPRGLNETLSLERRAWRGEPAVPGPRRVLDACSHRGHVLVLVADQDAAGTPSALAFDPKTAMWRALAPLPVTFESARLVEHAGDALLAARNGAGVSLFKLAP